MLTIRGQVAADYFNIICEKCGSQTKNEYLGGDPVVPHFKATCDKCKTSGVWKLDASAWKGLPLEAYKD